jgi:7-cyano-7-deazaguanine synthase
VVPARNLIFASILAGYAESIDAGIISLGVHGGDHHVYPDCRPAFISSLNSTVMWATDCKVRVDAPFLYNSKAEILRIGLDLKKVTVPYHLTRTCYKDQVMSCGKCGSCVERLEAFAEVGMIDPIKYE